MGPSAKACLPRQQSVCFSSTGWAYQRLCPSYDGAVSELEVGEEIMKDYTLKVCWSKRNFDSVYEHPCTDYIRGLTWHEATELEGIYERHRYCTETKIQKFGEVK